MSRHLPSFAAPRHPCTTRASPPPCEGRSLGGAANASWRGGTIKTECLARWAPSCVKSPQVGSRLAQRLPHTCSIIREEDRDRAIEITGEALLLGGTGFFFAIFLYLTIDTIGQVPERSNEQNLSESAVRGKYLFDRKNCMGCHTILGEGAYYAPELTKVYDRRGPEWMAIFLADPQAMFPGQRKMTQYNFTEGEIADLIAFLKWIGEIDTNGFPAEPDLAAAAAASAVVAAVQTGVEPPGFYTTVCRACHAVGGEGGAVGPALDGVASRYSEQELHNPARGSAGGQARNRDAQPAGRICFP